MHPTTNLRYVDRTEIVGGVDSKVRVLQQWWQDDSFEWRPDWTANGEWRDVPLVEVSDET